MKILFKILTIIIPVISSCGNEAGKSEDVQLSIEPQTIEFSAEGGEKSVAVTSGSEISLSPWDDWYTYRKTLRDKETSKTTVSITVPETTTTSERKSQISVVCKDQKQYIYIVQAGKPDIPTPLPPSPTPDPTPGEGAAIAKKLGIGWNLGNHFDSHNNGVAGETAWGNPEATQATFDKVKAAGFNTVRIPVTWMGQFGEAPDYQIEAAWLDRVAEVVGYAEKAGLNVILNMHHDGADSKYWLNIKQAASSPAVHEQIMEQIYSLWLQIAVKFADKGEFLIFEAFNEIHDGGWGWGSNRNDGGKQYKCLNEWNQTFVYAVRSAGGENVNRYLGIPAYCTNPDLAIETWEMPDDETEGRLLVSVHCYDPYDYTLPANKSEWGHTAATANKVSGNNEADLESVFKKLYNHFITKGIPVYLGEFGCVNRATAREQAFQQYYLRYYAKLSKIYGIPCAIWDNGAKGHGNEKHAYFDHATGEYCSKEAQAAIEALIDSYTNDLTLEQVYNTAP